jgi:hypothetical protein
MIVEAQPANEHSPPRSRPPRTVVNFDEIPADLRALPNWVLWRYERRGETWTKVPLRAGGGAAKSDDPSTWTTFEDARRAFEASKNADGIGFVFDGTGIVGIDLDNAIDDAGAVKPWARAIVESLASYTETTPSGRGLHVLARGSWEGRGVRRPRGDGEVETYQVGRYFTMTGRRVGEFPASIEDRTDRIRALIADLRPTTPTLTLAPPPSPDPSPAPAHPQAETPRAVVTPKGLGFPGDDDRLIMEAMEAKNGAKFKRLWYGETNGYRSTSEADLALANLIAWWAGPDPARIERIFGKSDLGQREKWKTRADYRAETIATALRGRTEFFRPRLRLLRDGGSNAAGEARTIATTDEARGVIRETWDVEILRVEKVGTGTDRAKYALVLPGDRRGEVGTAAAMLDQKRIRAALFEAGVVAAPLKPADWNVVVAALARLVEEIAPDDDEDTETARWIAEFVGGTEGTGWDAKWKVVGEHGTTLWGRLRSRAPWFVLDDRLAISLAHFRLEVFDRYGEGLTARALGQRLRRLGFEQTRLTARHGGEQFRQFYWLSPPEWDPYKAGGRGLADGGDEEAGANL